MRRYGARNVVVKGVEGGKGGKGTKNNIYLTVVNCHCFLPDDAWDLDSGSLYPLLQLQHSPNAVPWLCSH